MKKRLLCLGLALVLAFSLLTLTASAAPYSAYADAVKAAMQENGTDAPGYGMLTDLDGDGTDELLLLYRSADERANVVLSVYTMKGGIVETLLDHRHVFTEVGGDSGLVSVVQKDGKTLLLVERTSPEDYGPSEGGERVHVTGNASLYALEDGTLKRLSRLDYERVDVLPADGGDAVIEDTGFTCSEQTPDATEQRTLAQYKAWFDALERETVLKVWDFDNTSDGLPLALLLGRLEGHIGAFTDVPENEWYADSVEWALLHGVTNGTTDTTFSPDATCTRAQMVTFLWRAYGSMKLVSGEGTPFTDVSADAYYYEAVRWAVALGITNGTSETTFSPDATVTRAQTVTFLWRAAAHRSAALADFTDVPRDAYFSEAVGWAQENGVTNGMTATTFVPENPCTRAQIVTFLSRAMCAPGLHAQDVTGLAHGRGIDYATDEIGKEILFTAVGDVDDLAFVSVQFTESGDLRPDASVYHVGTLRDGECFLLRTGIPDVAARLAVSYTIGDRTVTLAIQDSGLDGSLYLIEI